MSYEVQEQYRGRSLDDESAEIAYLVFDAPDEVLARDAVLAVAPLDFDDKKLDNPSSEAVTNDIMLVRVSYKRGDLSESGDSRFTFDTSGGTQHLTNSFATINSYAAPGDSAPDFKGAIGVTKQGVEGVDVVVPVYAFTETHVLDENDVDAAYKGVLFALTGKVNIDTFKGLSAYECLFLGASGTQQPDGDWEIQFRFAGSPNKEGLSVGDIDGIDKKGWDYLWVAYEDDEDSDRLIKKPYAAYVERVYDAGDFSLLGIGT